jgi:hypothetical protein
MLETPDPKRARDVEELAGVGPNSHPPISTRLATAASRGPVAPGTDCRNTPDSAEHTASLQQMQSHVRSSWQCCTRQKQPQMGISKRLPACNPRRSAKAIPVAPGMFRAAEHRLEDCGRGAGSDMAKSLVGPCSKSPHKRATQHLLLRRALLCKASDILFFFPWLFSAFSFLVPLFLCSFFFICRSGTRRSSS